MLCITSDNSLAQFDAIAQALAGRGYVVLRDALSAEMSQGLLQLYESKQSEFYAAGVGRGASQNRHSNVRRDKIAWIDESDPLAAPWETWAQALRLYLNRQLFLGLFSFESHLAIYQPGDFYKTHMDAFRGQSNRRLSLVAYLNRDWRAGQGGSWCSTILIPERNCSGYLPSSAPWCSF